MAALPTPAAGLLWSSRLTGTGRRSLPPPGLTMLNGVDWESIRFSVRRLVQAVIAWSWDGMEYGPIAATRPEEEKRRAAQVLDREIAELTGRRGSHVPVAAKVIEGRPADVLAHAARSADLLALGSHGHSRVRHTVLGSVSEECIHKASCPIVVIPVPAPRREPASEPVLRS
jgi:nucleotide-binding universal stress UspA family protein